MPTARDRVRNLAPRVYKRYARLPHDTREREMEAEWVQRIGWHEAIGPVMVELERGSQLVIGSYGRQRYACMYREKPLDAGWPNAVTGWGPRPQEALSNLAFRWTVLMTSEWDPAKHAPLISEGGIRR